MKAGTLNVGDVVQLNPEKAGNPAFAACFMTVTEPKGFGAQGYIQVPGGGQAYYRAGWDEMEPIGVAEWTVE